MEKSLTETLLEVIHRNKLSGIARAYAVAVKTNPDNIQWNLVNAAIVTKLGPEALELIKELANAGKCGNNQSEAVCSGRQAHCCRPTKKKGTCHAKKPKGKTAGDTKKGRKKVS